MSRELENILTEHAGIAAEYIDSLKRVPANKEHSLEDEMQLLNERCTAYMSEADIYRVNDAFLFGHYYHHFENKKPEKVLRADGSEYMSHPVAVATILADGRCDADTIVAALLHDAFEDTHLSDDMDRARTTIRDRYGENVLSAVATVTEVTGPDQETLNDETVAKIFSALERDPRGILIKLADRLHNMRTIDHLKLRTKKDEIALQTLRIYVPLAWHLGLTEWSEELYERSIGVLAPDVIQEARSLQGRLHNPQRAELTAQMLNSPDALRGLLENPEDPSSLTVDIIAPSLYQFIESTGSKFRVVTSEEIQRIAIPLRITCRDAKDFQKIIDYFVRMGFVNPDQIRSIREGISTFTLTFSQVSYQVSLHSWDGFDYMNASLIDLYRAEPTLREEGDPGKLQFAHDHYMQMRAYAQEKLDKPRQRLAQLTAMGSEGIPVRMNVGTWLRVITNELQALIPYIAVKTPTGETRVCLEGSTVLDFAFSLSTDIGIRALSAQVNSVAVPLDTKMKEGDVVEINGSNRWEVSVDRLRMVSDPRYRDSIRKRLRRLLNIYDKWQGIGLHRFRRERSYTIGEARAELQETGIVADTDVTLQSFSEIVESIRRDGENEGEKELLSLYGEKFDGLPPVVDLERGWRFMGKDFHSRYRDFRTFLIDCGLGSVTKEQKSAYLDRVREYERDLPFHTYDVPDHKGVLAIILGVARIGANIVDIRFNTNLPGLRTGYGQLYLSYEIAGGFEDLFDTTIQQLAKVLSEQAEAQKRAETKAHSFKFSSPPGRQLSPCIQILEGLHYAVSSIDRDGDEVTVHLDPVGPDNDFIRTEDLQRVREILATPRE